MENYPKPSNRKELQRFWGLCNYQRRFIKDFAKMARPLHELTSKKINKLEWNEVHEQAFVELKRVMFSPPNLSFPSWSGKFVLRCK